MEVKKKKEEDKIEKQLAVNKEDTATEVHMLIPSPLLDPVNSLEGCFSFSFYIFFCCFTFSFVWQETILREQVEGLVEEDEEEEESSPNDDGEDVAVGGITLSDKKTERQRKREKAEKMKVS